MMLFRTPLLTLSLVLGLASADLCIPECDDSNVCKLTAKVNLFAGELGYYTFEECGDEVNPTIGMVIGKTYVFNQEDRSNYMHPLGFAYFPDGAHADVDELEPGIVPPGSNSLCGDTHTCPAPMYYMDGTYLGTYSPSALLKSDAQENFGLDDYEPKFFHPIPQWIEYGAPEIKLTFSDNEITQDIFYFCHIHELMSGRIRLLNEDNSPLVADETPAIETDYYDAKADSFDEACGTFNLTDFQDRPGECPDRFVCTDDSASTELSNFGKCIDAMNCHMMVGMTSNAVDEKALFIHQMIPHHQNAVNMAKALLKTGKVKCDDLTGEDEDCVLETILREIINGQNAQIQAMRGILDSLAYPAEADCKVEFSSAWGISTWMSGLASILSLLTFAV